MNDDDSYITCPNCGSRMNGEENATCPECDHYNGQWCACETCRPRECEFCGDPATRIEEFDRPVYVCDQCSALPGDDTK